MEFVNCVDILRYHLLFYVMKKNLRWNVTAKKGGGGRKNKDCNVRSRDKHTRRFLW